MASASPTIDPSLQSLGGSLAVDPAESPSGGVVVVGGPGHGEEDEEEDDDDGGGVAGDMTANEITAVLEMAAAANANAGAETLQQAEKAKPDTPAKLAKAKVHQCAALREAAEKALAGIWGILDSAEDPSQPIQVSRALDRTFGQLHALSTTYKPDYKALIWIADIPLKSIRENYRAGPGPAYFAVKKTNMAFVAEYMLYAMPNEAGFGKNDLVFACEGLLPLVPPIDLLEQEETWKLFNELKIQIYIQRLHTLGREEADQRVLPNLFVETLSSYAGQPFSDHLQQRFDDLGKQSRAEIVVANGDVESLMREHPYEAFLAWALRFLRTCSDRLDAEIQEYEVQHPEEDDKPKKGRKPNHYRRVRGIGGLADAPGFGLMAQLSQQQADVPFRDDTGDIQVERPDDDQAYEGGDGSNRAPRKPRFNPYRLGRGKGAMAAPRRRWTNEELDLLMDEVRLHAGRYDCMAQIIKRHGKNGEISQTLRDQNNVSLKDKARNLTMEWARNGYPKGKEWAADAFARFAVKGKK